MRFSGPIARLPVIERPDPLLGHDLDMRRIGTALEAAGKAYIALRDEMQRRVPLSEIKARVDQIARQAQNAQVIARALERDLADMLNPRTIRRTR